MSETIKPLVYRGTKEICAVVGLNYKQFTTYIKQHGLPAFRIAGKTQWLATHTDLERWINEQRDKYLMGGEQ